MRDWTAFRIVLLLLASPAWAQRSPGPTDTTTPTRRIPPSLMMSLKHWHDVLGDPISLLALKNSLFLAGAAPRLG